MADLTKLPTNRKHIVTLSGYIGDIPSKVDEALALYMVASFDQSYSWGEIPSLSKAVQKGGNHVENVAGYIQEDLTSLFEHKFDKIKISVTNADKDSGKALVTLSIDIEVFDSNYQDKLTRILELENGKFRRLITMNNG